MTPPVYLIDAQRKAYAKSLIDLAMPDHCMVIKPPSRTLDQNAKLWPMLEDVSLQVSWYGRKLTPTNWKDIFTAEIRNLDVVPNLSGTGFVALGKSTSNMSKREFSDLIELIYAFGAEKNVVWSAPKERKAS